MYPDRDTFAQSLQRAEYSSMFFLYDYLRESPNIRHGLMLLWFTGLMNVTEEVTIHGPKVSTLLSSAFIRGDLNAAKRGSFYMIKALNVWSLGKLVLFSLESLCFPRPRLEKHQDSRENKTNCFPRDHTLSVKCSEILDPGFCDINLNPANLSVSKEEGTYGLKKLTY